MPEGLSCLRNMIARNCQLHSFHTFMDTQCKWSTTEQEAYGIYYVVTKWNNYLQGSDIVVCNEHKPLQKFLNGRNTNNKVNRWSLELATYNINFGVDIRCLQQGSWLPFNIGRCPPTMPTALINMLVTSTPDGPATHTCSKIHNNANTTPVDPTTASTNDMANVPSPLTEDRKVTLRLMQRTDPFCKCIFIRLLSGKAPLHEVDTFTHPKGLIYKHIMDANKRFWH